MFARVGVFDFADEIKSMSTFRSLNWKTGVDNLISPFVQGGEVVFSCFGTRRANELPRIYLWRCSRREIAHEMGTLLKLQVPWPFFRL